MALRTPLYLQKTGADADISYTAQSFREMLPSLIDGEGVQNYQAFRVHQRTAGANFTIEIEPGSCYVQGDDVADQGMYFCKSTAVEALTIPAPPGAGSRTHRVILQVRDKFHNGAWSTYDFLPLLQTDAGAGTPALPASALTLATITVAAGTASITDSLITPTRVPIQFSEQFARITRATNQNIVTATVTPVQFTAEDLDLWGMANLTAANTRITAVKAGVYHVEGYFRHIWTGTTQKVEIHIAKNGVYYEGANQMSSNSDPDYHHISCDIVLAAGDYIQLTCYHSRPTDITITNSSLSARWVAASS